MAIIRLDCNLNGGDSVTPNNELFYRIYGDVDAYADPIHTTGTALSDANVTVNNDNVIITGVDGTTNTEFKIAAVDGAGNEGILSDAVGSSILFQDDFTGTVIDTAKWRVINTDPTLVGINQDNALELSQVAPGSTTLGNNNISCQDAFPKADTIVLAFDLASPDSPQEGMATWTFGLVSDRPDINKDWRISFYRGGSVNTIAFSIHENAVAVYDTTAALDYTTEFKTLKIILTPTNVDFQYYNGSAWVSMGDYDHSLTPTDFYVAGMQLANSSVAVNLDNTTFNNLVVTNSDYSTLRP